jgi:hypothetical protein
LHREIPIPVKYYQIGVQQELKVKTLVKQMEEIDPGMYARLRNELGWAKAC